MSVLYQSMALFVAFFDVVPCENSYGAYAKPCERRYISRPGEILVSVGPSVLGDHLVSPISIRASYIFDPNSHEMSNPLFFEARDLWSGRLLVQHARISRMEASRNRARNLMRLIPEDERCNIDYYELALEMNISVQISCGW